MRRGFTLFRRGFTFLENVVYVYKNKKYYWRFTFLRRGLNFYIKGGSRL